MIPEWLVGALVTVIVALIGAFPVWRKLSSDIALIQAQVKGEEAESEAGLSDTALALVKELREARRLDKAEFEAKVTKLTNQIELWREGAMATQAELELLKRTVRDNEIASSDRYQILEEENRMLERRVQDLRKELEKYRQINERLQKENGELKLKLAS